MFVGEKMKYRSGVSLTSNKPRLYSVQKPYGMTRRGKEKIMQKGNQLKSCCENSLSSPNTEMTNGADRFSRSVIPQGFYAGYSERNVKAFTLIELLVVVLIIGILAAVALPQYQKVVERSKATQAITLLKSVYNAAKAYQLANGDWPQNFDELAVDIPFTGTANGIGLGHHLQGKSNTDWSIQIRNSAASYGGTKGIVVTRRTGPYAKTAFYIYAIPEHEQVKPDELVCIEMVIDGFQKSKGSYCNKIMKATLLHTSSEGAWNTFRMP